MQNFEDLRRPEWKVFGRVVRCGFHRIEVPLRSEMHDRWSWAEKVCRGLASQLNGPVTATIEEGELY